MPKYRKIREYHGGTGTRLYSAYKGMRDRCLYPDCKDYPRYGGRGITIAKSLDTFVKFRAWFEKKFNKDELPEGLFIDRINNDKGYAPGNIRLATMKEQQNNRSTNKLITYAGKTQTISEWSTEIGINRKTLEKRLGKYGWSAHKALTTKSKRQPVTVDGVTGSIADVCKALGICRGTYYWRKAKGYC